MNPDADRIFRRFSATAKLRHFSLLIQLHDLRNMKRAAEALGLSQPAVSLAVSDLEKLLGVQLFLRHARGVEPTQVASDLVPIARRIMAALGDGAEVVSNVINESAGFVRISATPAAISAMLFPLTQVFARKFPAVHIEISEINAADPLEPISDGSCDILCLRETQTMPENWTFEESMSDALVVICGAQHPLSAQCSVSNDDLRAFPWLIHRRGSIARNRFESIAQEIDLPANKRCGVVTHIPMLTRELLMGGNFLALMPRSVAIPWFSDGSVVEIDCPANTAIAPLGFLWQPDSASRITRKIAGELTSHRASSS